MREDMAKVIVERPRRGSRIHGKPKGYSRRLQRLGPEGSPICEGIKKRAQGGTKMLNEHLGPLRRFLNARVGQHWDKVFSEICARVDRNSAVQDHVRDHVDDYVAVHVVLIDGIPCSGEGGMAYGRPLGQGWKRWYVCPRSGILKRVKGFSRHWWRNQPPPPPPRYVPLGKTLQCRLIDGAWHLVTLERLPCLPTLSKARDILLNRAVALLDIAEAEQNYGAAVYAVAVRRLSRKELKQYPIPVDDWK